MGSGQILVGAHRGVYVIKLVGDVRLDLCTSFDKFINKMFTRGDFKEVVFDLHDTKGADSTTLGLSAKIAMRALKHSGHKPLALNANKSLRRLLYAMGFDSLMEISDQLQSYVTEPAPLLCKAPDEQAARAMVLEAHKVLMGMNQHNADTFRNLVHALESESEGNPGAIHY